MDIPLNAWVRCADGDGGHTTRIVLNPATKRVTHIVVREPGLLGVERLVPVEAIVVSAPHMVTLGLTRNELAAMPNFVTSELVTRPDEPLELVASPGAPFLWPDEGPGGERLAMRVEAIPPDELAVRRGDRVEATDGPIGRVDELLVDPVTEGITHLVLREGHLWAQKDVTIPVAQIARVDEGAVYLKLDKHAVKALPAVPVRRGG